MPPGSREGATLFGFAGLFRRISHMAASERAAAGAHGNGRHLGDEESTAAASLSTRCAQTTTRKQKPNESYGDEENIFTLSDNQNKSTTA